MLSFFLIPATAKAVSCWSLVDLEKKAFALGRGGSKPLPPAFSTWMLELALGEMSWLLACPIALAACSSCFILAERWIGQHIAVVLGRLKFGLLELLFTLCIGASWAVLLEDLDLLGWFCRIYFWYHAMFGFVLCSRLDLARLGLRTRSIPQGCPFSMFLIVALLCHGVGILLHHCRGGCIPLGCLLY